MGLRSFVAEDRHRFFGRLHESHEIAALWQANRLTVLYGASGVGKTSVLLAGAIPLIDSRKTDILPIGRVSHGSAFPVAALPEHNPYTFALLSSWSPDDPPTRLGSLTIQEFLRRRGQRVDRYGDPVPVLVAIDQAEELFADFPHRRQHRDPFIEQLTEALDENPDVRLLLSIREDSLAAILPYERILGRDARARVQLPPLSPDAAVEAVRGPLADTRREFTREAAEILVDDLRTIKMTDAVGERFSVTAETVEPVQLQVVCSALWTSLPDDVTTITPAHVNRYADVDRSLTDFVHQALAEVADDHDVPLEELRSWLRDTFITEVGTRGTAYEGLTRTAGMRNEVVRALVDRHVLKAETRSGSRWCELQHDRLIEPINRASEGGVADVTSRPVRPVSAAEYLRAAELALADGELALAEKHAEEAVRACGDGELRVHAETESFLGNIGHERRQWEKAETHYRVAASLYEALGDTAVVGRLLAAIGQLLLRQGRRSEAVDELRAAALRVPNDLIVQTELAWALWGNGHPRTAVAILSGVLAIDGNTPEALRARGEIQADLGEAEAALRDLDRVRRYPRPSALAARALALAQLGRAGEGAEDLRAALAAVGDHGPTLYYAAQALMLMGETVRGAELARRASEAADPPLPPHQRAAVSRLLGG